MRQPLILGSGTHYFPFNTVGTNGAPITLAGTPALRASINGGDYVNAGLTLSVDHDYNGASAVVGLHRIALDIDNATLALVDGDEVDIILNAGTVDSVSKAGTVLWRVVAVADGLTVQQKNDVNEQVDSALDTAVPGTPTANSINERIKTIDDANLPGRTPAALSAGGNMKSDVKEVNDVTIQGVGTAGNPWGPV